MRALVYPASGYISDNLRLHLQQAGHQVIEWNHVTFSEEEQAAAWQAALPQATAIFHQLQGHEAHAKTTVLQLVQQQASTGSELVTFIGISTPLTWATTAATAMPPLTQRCTCNSDAGSAAPAASAVQLPPTLLADITADGQAAAAAGALQELRLTDRDAPSRHPAAAAINTYHTEQLILRCNRAPAGLLSSYVVCPGILYGQGEGDSLLHPLFKAAWEGREPLQILGDGSNRLPTLHVRDLASFAEGVVLQQPQGSRYLLAVDDALITQAALVPAVGSLLGNKETQTWSTADCVLTAPTSPVLLLDLPISSSAWPQQPPASKCCPNGLLGHLPQVLSELLETRRLKPLKIVIRGAPAAGKTHIGKRLADLYDLEHINPATILAELPFMDSDSQKVAAAQLSSKEGRLTPLLMARLLQHLLARLPKAGNQGWVLEGWPKTLAAARAMTSDVSAATGAAAAGAAEAPGVDSKPGNKKDHGAYGKDRSRQPGAQSAATNSSSGMAAGSSRAEISTAGGAGRGRRISAASVEDDLAGIEGGQAVMNMELLPQFVIDITAPEEELLRRVKVLAAAEAAAAAGAVAAASGPGKPGTGAPPANAAKKPISAGKAQGNSMPVLVSHNNEKDWTRRMEAHRQILAKEAADLAAKRQAAGLSGQTSASSSPADTPGRAPRATGDHTAPSSRATTAGSHASAAACVPAGSGSRSAVAPAAGDGVEQQLGQTEAAKAPGLAGFAAFFVDAGAKYLAISNPFDEAAAAAAAATCAGLGHHGPHVQQQQHSAGAALPELCLIEQQLKTWIGPPHNYKGFPHISNEALGCAAVEQERACDSSSSTSGAGGAALSQTSTFSVVDSSVKSTGCQESTAYAAGGSAGGTGVAEASPGGPACKSSCSEVAEILQLAQELVAEQEQRVRHQLEEAARPLQATLMAGVMPAVMAGLVKVALDRPVCPLQVIADELLAAAEALESSYKDPYSDPAYGVQQAKVEAKAKREAARAAAAAAKAAREQTAAFHQAKENAAEAAAALAGAGTAALSGDSAAIGSRTMIGSAAVFTDDTTTGSPAVMNSSSKESSASSNSNKAAGAGRAAGKGGSATGPPSLTAGARASMKPTVSNSGAR